MAEKKGYELKVGIFLIICLVLGTAVVFVLGSEQKLFRKRVVLTTTFLNAGGLKVGSQVRLAGLKIGMVDRISFSRDTRDKRVLVRMKILASALERIRRDSTARIRSSGLLGDALIEISIGVKGKPLSSGEAVSGITEKGLGEYMADADQVVGSLKKSLKSIESILKQYTDPKLSKDVKRIVGSLATTLRKVNKGPGLAHDLFHSRKLARSLRGTMRNFRRVSSDLARTSSDLRRMVRGVRRSRDSLFSRIFLAKGGKKTMNDIGTLVTSTRKAVDSLNRLLKAPEKKGTLLHSLLYGKQKKNLLDNLTLASADLRSMMKDVRRGKGTLGAIVNDPTAFEDFKTILGQVKRSRIYRALIRFVIERDDREKGGVLRKR